VSAPSEQVAFTIDPLPPVPVVAEPTRMIGVCDAGSAKTQFTVANPPDGGAVVWLSNGTPVLTNAVFTARRTPWDPRLRGAGVQRGKLRERERHGD